MAGTSTASAALAVSDALRNAAATVINDPTVFICEGLPGNGFPDDIVSFGKITTLQDPATLGTMRSRTEHLTIEVKFSIFRGGGTEADVKHRAFALLALLEVYTRRTDPTLGGLCNWCFLTGTSGESESAPEILQEGRAYDLTAIFSANVRITG